MRRRSKQSARLERLEERRLLSGASEGNSTFLDQLSLPDQPEAPIPAALTASAALTPVQRAALTTVEPMLAAVVGGTATTGRQPAGALTGKVVFTVGGHGFVAYTGGWHTQRGEVSGTEMVEDLGNQDQMTFYVNYLWNAGATVVPLRPVGYQPNEVVLDNDSAQVTYTGTWSNSSSTIFYGDAGDVPYRYASTNATETATARYTPNIPVAGFYPVYAWTKDDSDRVNQTYRVVHPGGTTVVQVDHRRVGKGWVYLGWYYLNAGTGAYVEISNQNATSGIVVADAIRFGNGMGDIDRGLGVSGQSRSDESALYWIEAQKGQGVADSVFRGTIDTDDDDNVGAPPRWAAWMNRDVAGTNTERIFLSYHSNAGGGRGDIGLYNNTSLFPGTATPHQFEWAQLVGKETNDDMVALNSQLEYAWYSRSNPTYARSDYAFGEINNSVIGNEFDATILEVAFHDSTIDAALMRDPKVRDYVARASLQATIKYFRTYNSEPALALPPDSPTNVRSIVQANGDVTISWAAPVVDGIGGEAATGYVVYRGTDGYSFGTAVTVAGGGTLSYTIPAAQLAAGANYFRVAATNAGGESMPSEVVGNLSNAGPSPILIVQGFDRMARQLNPTQTTPLSYAPPPTPGSGNTFERVRPLYSNRYDYVTQAGEAIEAYLNTIGFDTASNEAVIAGQVNLANYAAVIWLSGEESTIDDTFNATEQSLMTTYLGAGGKLFVSGSELGFDLDSSGGGASFYNNQLKADFVSDDAGTYTASGAAGSIFAGISLTFDNGNSGTYNVDAPDVITTSGGSTIAMNYTGASTGGAAVQYANAGTGAKVVNLAFPFETITTSANRNAVMSAALNYFGLNAGSISGRVYVDRNGNGTYDGGDAVAPNHVVFVDLDRDDLLDGNEPSATTDASGNYLIGNVPGGTHWVRLQPPNTMAILLTQPANGSYHEVTVGATPLSGIDFGKFLIEFAGSSGNDSYYIRLDPTGTRTEISLGNSPANPPTLFIDKTKLTGLIFDGAGGDDTVTVDASNGIPTSVTFTGGANGASGDLLRVIGSSAADFVGITSSIVAFNNASGSMTNNIVTIERVQVDSGDGDDTVGQAPGVTTALSFNGGASTVADTLNLNGGSMTFSADASVATSNLVLNIGAGASAAFAASQHLAGLSVSGTATVTAGGSKVLVTKSFSVSGTLDLNDNSLIHDYTGPTPHASIFSRVAAGRNGGAWNGSGIRSTAAGSSGLRGLGLAEASDVLKISGAQTALFAGQSVDATALLIRFTFAGDLDLDGAIDADDFFRIDFNYPKNTFGYAAGDIDYDASIDGDDYFWIDANYSAQ